jgi:hypothetical protein
VGLVGDSFANSVATLERQIKVDDFSNSRRTGVCPRKQAWIAPVRIRMAMQRD